MIPYFSKLYFQQAVWASYLIPVPYWILYGEWLAAPRDPAIFDAPKKIMV
jgi:hypothetical protein